MDLHCQRVAIAAGAPQYPVRPPFNPGEVYPELPYPSSVDESNGVYGLVREAMRLLGMDSAHYGKPEWNPLGEVVGPGERVLIKPNFVLDQNYGLGPVEAVITHASVLRVIADYALIALKKGGQLIIADAPQMNCKWAKLLQVNGIGHLAGHLKKICEEKGIEFELRDLRQEETAYKYGIVWERKRLKSPEGRTVNVDLGADSLMHGVDVSRLYGADYNRRTTVHAHLGQRHEYCIAREAIEADVVISVPKLKVHSKVGTTLNIKNMVGINTDKNHLAHYRIGSVDCGGDEFSNPTWDDLADRWFSDALLGHFWHIGKYPFVLWRAFRKMARTIFPAMPGFVYGNWSGNDTAWRMALDLNRALLTADLRGVLRQTPQRKYFSFIDGIVGGQGNGPLSPDAYLSGVILAGANPLSVDWVATRLMGFDPRRISMYSKARTELVKFVPGYDVSQITVASNMPGWNDLLAHSDSVFEFAAAPGWRDSIECYTPKHQATCTSRDTISRQRV